MAIIIVVERHSGVGLNLRDMKRLLSIIVPSFNMEKYLPKCLGSLLVGDEHLGLIEVIVVNDGSKDGTSEIAHDFKRRYPGVFRVIDKQNGHYGSCINAALNTVQGQYVKVLDADDSFDTVAFERYLKEIKDGPDCDLITNDFVVVDGSDVVTEQGIMPYPEGQLFDLDEVSKAKRVLIMHCSAYRSSIFKEMEYKQTEGIVYTDSQWMFMPMSRVKQIRHISAPVYRYLVGREEQSVDKRQLVKNIGAQKIVFQSLLEFYQANVDNASSKYVRYMRRYLIHIFAMISNVYWQNVPLSRIAEWYDVYGWMKNVYPEGLENAIQMGILGRRFMCYQEWRRSRFPFFWILIYRIYYRVRGCIGQAN